MKLASLLFITFLFAFVPVYAQNVFNYKKIAVFAFNSPECRAQSLDAAKAAVEKARADVDRERAEIWRRRLKALQEIANLKGSYRKYLKARAEFEQISSPKLADLEATLATLERDQSSLRKRFWELGRSIAAAQDVGLFPYRPDRDFWDPAIEVTAGLCLAIDEFVRNGSKLAYRFNLPDAKFAYLDSGKLLSPSTSASRLSRAWAAVTRIGTASADARAVLNTEPEALEAEMKRFIESKGWTYVFTVKSPYGKDVVSNRGHDLTNEFISYYNQRYP